MGNIKPMPQRVNVPPFSPWLYRSRNLVERFFNKLKHSRAIDRVGLRQGDVIRKFGITRCATPTTFSTPSDKPKVRIGGHSPYASSAHADRAGLRYPSTPNDHPLARGLHVGKLIKS